MGNMENAYLSSQLEGEGSPENAEVEVYSKGILEKAGLKLKNVIETLKELGGNASESLIDAAKSAQKGLEKVAPLITAGGIAACAPAERPAVETALNQHCTGEPITMEIQVSSSTSIEETIDSLVRDGYCAVSRPEPMQYATPGEDAQVTSNRPGYYTIEVIPPEHQRHMFTIDSDTKEDKNK